MLDADIIRPDEIQRKDGYHHGNLRNSIIDAVAQLVGERRSANFQLKDIAELVGTSQPAIYKHFENKHALIVETAVAGYAIQKQFRDHAINAAPPSPLHQLLAIGYAYVHFSVTCPGYFVLMKYFETDEMLGSKRYQQERDETLDLIRGLINRCVDEGLFIDVDVDIAMTMLQSTAFGLAHQYLGEQMIHVARERHKDKDLVVKVFTLSIGSLLTRKGRSELKCGANNPFA